MESHDLEDQLIERAPTLAGPVQVLSSEQRSGRTVHSVSASRLVPVDDKDPVLRDISIAVPVTAEVEVDDRGRVTRVSADDVDPAAAREARAFTRTLIANGAVRGLPQTSRLRRAPGPPQRATHEVVVDRSGRKVIRRTGFDMVGPRKSLRS